MDEVHYTKYYVAFLDILGFKNIVNDPKRSCRDILRIYNFLESMPNNLFKNAEGIHKCVKAKIMSDSICLYIEEDFPNALFYLIIYCLAIQAGLLMKPPSVPCTWIRGGITLGDMYVEKDIVFGPALTEAYLLEEKNAKVPRIIIRKDTLDSGMEKMDDKRRSISAFLFRDEDAFYTINYLKYIINYIQDNAAQKCIEETISHYLDTTIDESIRQKYLYLEKNIHKCLKEKTDA